jgi:hypothetical protein
MLFCNEPGKNEVRSQWSSVVASRVIPIFADVKPLLGFHNQVRLKLELQLDFTPVFSVTLSEPHGLIDSY